MGILFGIWDHEREDWLREADALGQEYGRGRSPILAYESVRAAQQRAREHWGFSTYTEVRRKGWAEARQLPGTIGAR
jgi:hypothetical protein